MRERTRQWLRRRWWVVLMLAVMVLTGVRIAQYRADVMRLLHSSADCHAPCFMGITPGKTTRTEVIDILNTHPDVIEYQEYPEGYFDVSWRGFENWFGRSGQFKIASQNNVVSEIRFNDQLPLIAFIVVLGFPDGQAYENSYAYVDEAMWISMNCQSSYFNALTNSYADTYFTSPKNTSFNNLQPHQLYLNKDCSWFGPLF